MFEHATVARPYARGVFEQAREQKQLEPWSEALAILSGIVSDPTVRKLIHDPRIAVGRLTDLILSIGGDKFFPMVKNFVKLLIAAGRIQFAPEIARQFEELRAQTEGRSDIEIVTAYELSEEEGDRLAKAISKRLGKEVNVTTQVDKALIGGALIRMGDQVIDASVRGRLQQLSANFA